ncbi:alpha/beta hydrolase [Peptoniphilus sp. ING2-D1G]|nr:alpha/beta hydrolase [Peptoniphilus sp. ING2-D1G]
MKPRIRGGIIKEKIIKTNYGNINLWISDVWNVSRETIFFFHGLTANHSMFEKQIEYFGQKYNCILWDAPMHGKSKGFSNFTMDMAVEIIQTILKTLSVEKIIAVGQSFGGYFIQALMCRDRNVVKLFIGIGTTPYGRGYYSDLDYFWLSQVGWMSMLYPYEILKKSVAKATTTTKAGYENMMKMLEDYSKREYSHLMQVYYDAFMQDNQDLKITCPLLITVGEFDGVGKVKKYCEEWSKKEGQSLKIIKKAGHNANVDNPKLTNEVIERFIMEN